MNEANMKAMQTQIDMVKNELRTKMKSFIQTSLSNQTNEIKNMMASLFQMNTASTLGSGSLPSNNVANLKGELKAITTRSGLVIDGPTIPTPSKSSTPEVDERVEETFMDQADFIIVDYESDPRVPLILGRPFLWTARALIDVHGEEMILHDGDERLTLNMRHDTSSYSNQPQRESINLSNVFNNSSEDFLKVLFSNQPSGNPTFLPHPELTSPKVATDIFDSEGCNVLSEKLPDLNYTKDLHPPPHDNLLKIEFLLYQDKDSSLKDSIDQKGLVNLDAIFVDPIPEMFTDEHTLDYSSPPIFDVYDDDFLEVESDTGNVYDDPFDSKEEKIKESKLLIDKLDLPCHFLPPSEYDSFISQDFSRVDALPSTNNEDKVFNPGILIQEKPVKNITRVVQNKKQAISNASLVLDFDPPFYEPLFFKEVPKSKMLLLFSSKNEEKVFKPGIYTSEMVHSYFIPELSHQGYKIFKVNQIFKTMMKIFLFYYEKNTPILDVLLFHFYFP
nr:reverse transcriptase domain-containing protein [Tanacetum cinerariifolium]